MVTISQRFGILILAWVLAYGMMRLSNASIDFKDEISVKKSAQFASAIAFGVFLTLP